MSSALLLLVAAGVPPSNTNVYLTVTQTASRIFGTATDRMVDRWRLRKAAERACLMHSGLTNQTAAIRLRIESFAYIDSNKVEAVFRVE